MKIAGSDSEGRNKVRMAMEKGDGDGRMEGRMEGIAEACPLPDTGEATEKLYERHCLVIKIVSSFFASLTKFSYL